MRSRVYEIVERLSVRPVIWPPHGTAAGLLLWVQQLQAIDRLLHGSAAVAPQQQMT